MTDEIDRVRDVPDGDEYTLVTDMAEKRRVFESLGIEYEPWKEGGLFVKSANGEYEEVLYFPGLVPYLSHPVTRVYPDGDDEPRFY